MIKKICSGGQTGVDLGALYAAQYLGIETGGFAARGWMTENGPQEELLRGFGLVECPRPGYPARTEMNVRESFGTIIVTKSFPLTGGSYTTECLCYSFSKPFMTVPSDRMDESLMLSYARMFFNKYKIINVAGPRESKWRGAQSLVMDWLIRALEQATDR